MLNLTCAESDRDVGSSPAAGHDERTTRSPIAGTAPVHRSASISAGDLGWPVAARLAR